MILQKRRWKQLSKSWLVNENNSTSLCVVLSTTISYYVCDPSLEMCTLMNTTFSSRCYTIKILAREISWWKASVSSGEFHVHEPGFWDFCAQFLRGFVDFANLRYTPKLHVCHFSRHPGSWNSLNENANHIHIWSYIYIYIYV